MYTASVGPEQTLRPTSDFGAVAVSVDGTRVQTVPLAERVLTVGRLPENGLVLADPSVSRRHAELRVEATGLVVTDLGSAGGTAVGEARAAAHQPVAWEAGVAVRIGPYVLEYLPPARPAGGGAPRLLALDLSDPARAATPARAPTPLALTPSAHDEPLPAVPARPTFPAPLPPVGESRYLRDLPAVFQDNDFLGRMLQIYEAIWEPLEQRQDHLALYFAPRTCPGPFLPWLASWLHLAINPHWPEEHRRRLLGEAMELYRWRGTSYGLTRMIEVCTGLTPTIREDPERAFVFHVRVRVPAGSGVRREVVEELVRQHKPAHVGYTLEVEP